MQAILTDLLLYNLFSHAESHLQVSVCPGGRGNVHGRAHVQTEDNVVLQRAQSISLPLIIALYS